MDILTEDQHRALAFIQACNNQRHGPRLDEVERWLTEPSRPLSTMQMLTTQVGSLGRLFGQGAVTDQLVRLGWVYLAEARQRLYTSALGEALLRDADARLAEVGAATTVVLDATDPLAYATLMSELASAGAGMLIDPYIRREQLLHIIQDTLLERVLVGQNLKAPDLDGLRAMLGYLPPGRQLEVRVAEDAHDRYLKSEGGEVFIIGSSMGTVSRQKSSTVITPFPQDSAEMIAKMLKDRWDAGEPLRPVVVEPEADEDASA